jgi:hypothetical protein
MSDASLHELLSAWLDGQLTGSEKARAERLVSDNPECADLVRQWKLQREQIRALPRYRLDSDFSMRVLAAAVDNRANRSDQPVTPWPVAKSKSQAAAQESTSYFASRSALTAITALAATLLLTLFTLPTRVLTDGTAVGANFEKARPARAAVDREPDEIQQPRKSKEGDAQFAASKEGFQALTTDDSRRNLAAIDTETARAESAAETDDGLEPAPLGRGIAKGGAGGDMKRESFDSPGELAERSLPGDGLNLKVADALEKAKQQVVEMEPRAQRVPDLANRQDENQAEEKLDLGAQLANQPVPAEPAIENWADKAEPGGFDQKSQTFFADQDVAKDKVAPEMSIALQLAANSVDEVWMIEIAESPSLKKLEQAMRQNSIVFKKSSAQFGQQTTGAVLGELDDNVQAIYVVTSSTQIRGAIRMLSRNAEINAFPLPTIPPNDPDSGSAVAATRYQPAAELSDQAAPGQGLQQGQSLAGFPYSFAQQLPSNLRMKASLDPDEKLRLLNFGLASGKAASATITEKVDSGANPVVIPESPAPAVNLMVPSRPQIPLNAVPPVSTQEALARQAGGQPVNREGQEEMNPLYRTESGAGQQVDPGTDIPQSGVRPPMAQKSELQRRYLLLIRFDPETTDSELAPPSGGN